MNYKDIRYSELDHVAHITIDRPEVYNAFRPLTVEELIHAFQQAGWNTDIGAIVLAGAGKKAFCTGGDQSVHDQGSYSNDSGKVDRPSVSGETGQSEAHHQSLESRGTIGMPIEELHAIIRDVPKPVIAKVQGYAIGGGNVLATLCDMTLAGESAVFGQVGPKMGSVDPGFGTAYLSRVVGEKKAREIWFMCRRYSAQEALEMGLVNKVVADAELDKEVDSWCAELVQRSPTAIAIAKRSFNADSDNIKAIGGLGMHALKLYYDTAESQEGVAALKQKRQPEFRKFVK